MRWEVGWGGGSFPGGTACPAALPGLPGGTTVSGLSEPPSWGTDGQGGGAPGRGCISCGQGSLLAGQVQSRCEQAQELGSRVQKRGAWRRPTLGLSTRGLCGQRPGWAAQRKRLPFFTLVLRGSFLTGLCGRDDKQFTSLLLSDKTGHLYVLPVYSCTHRYNKISLNIKGKTQRYME